MAAVTFIDYLGEIGRSGQASIALFMMGVVYAALIHFRRLGLRYRLAFIPLSLLPLVIGVFGLSFGTVRIISESRTSAIFNIQSMLYHFGEILQIMSVASLATAILLGLSFLLLLSKYAETQTT